MRKVSLVFFLAVSLSAAAQDYVFNRAPLAENHFAESTGYGYNDSGRETLEQVYADIFHAV